MKGLFGTLAAPARKDAQTLDSLPGFLLGLESKAGVSVTWSTALQVTTMWACCRAVGEGLAQSRLRLMRSRKNGRGADVATDHALHQLVFLRPSAGQTAFGLIETLIFHLMLVGNAYVFINRVGGDRIHELLLLDPGHVRVTHNADRTIDYDVAGEGGTYRRMPRGSIWHLRGPSWNGWMGMEAVKVAREALGLSLALEASHAELHKNGIKPSGFYSIEGELEEQQFPQLAKWLKRFAAAGDMAGMPMILDRGAKWLTQQMSGVDLQHLETRRFQIEEVCRAARVMPIMVGQSDKTATYSSSEQMFLAHVIHTLSPWAGRIEQSAAVGLLTDAEILEGLFFLFNLSVMMRGDYKGRQEGLQIQRRNGVISANEWRALENMNPREDDGGDQYIVEANMALQDGRDLPAVTTPATTKKGENDDA